MTNVTAIQSLLEAAQNNQTLTLTSAEVREVALTLMGMDNMIAAYVNEYGQELADELTSGNIIEGEIIEEDDGAVTAANMLSSEALAEAAENTKELNSDEKTQETGLAGEDDGVYSSEEE